MISGPRDKRLDFAPERSVSVVVGEAGDTHEVRLQRPPGSVRARPGKHFHVLANRIEPSSLMIESGFTLRRRGVEAKLALDQAAPEIDRTLSRSLSLGWSWLNEIKRGASMEEIASRNGISQRAIARLIDLAFLAPDIVDAIIAGRQPVNLTANALIRAMHQRLWHDQRAMIAAL